MIRVVADENIPDLEALLGNSVVLTTMPGAAINRDAAAGADALLVRSVTRVHEELLAGSPVRFVGTATAGSDHIDREALRSLGVAFADAPGSNAESVVEYVIAALLRLSVRTGTPLTEKRLGIIGAGRVGGRLAVRAPTLGVRVVVNDPPRADAEGADPAGLEFVSLETALACDAVSLHVPLIRHGRWPTYHLLGPDALPHLRRSDRSPVWLLQTSRGGVIDETGLFGLLKGPGAPLAVLDVWEGEPAIDADLAARCAMATPHIAGYSRDAKRAGARMVSEALRAHFGLGELPAASTSAPAEEPRLVGSIGSGYDGRLPNAASRFLDGLTRQMYDIERDDEALRATLGKPNAEDEFKRLRRAYPLRSGFGRFEISEHDLPACLRAAVGIGLGVRIV